MQEHTSLLNSVIQIVGKVADIIKDAPFSVTEKNEAANIVTTNDLASQKHLMKELSALLLNSGFYCEEEGVCERNKEYVWVIDPIDGTTNYLRGITECAISVALLKNQKAVLGVVYCVFSGDVYSAVLGVIGILFSFITIRYREYKEVYWLCCQALTVLRNFKEEKLDKQTVQKVFYHCLRKKGKGYLYEKNGGWKFNKWLYVRKNTQSSETFYFMIIALMSSFILALGAFLILPKIKYASIIICAGIGLFAWVFLLCAYFQHCIKVYACLEKKNKDNDQKTRDKAFNKVFSKAWFLHFYYDEK